MEAIREALNKPFKEKEIEWRVQRVIEWNWDKLALMLPYVESRAIMDRLDDVFWVFWWTDEYSEHKNWIKCKLTVTSTDWEIVSKEDWADESNVEATKWGFSNSLKRTAVKFGIWRYLYHFENQMLSENNKEFTTYIKNWKPVFKKLTKEWREKLDLYHKNNKDV